MTILLEKKKEEIITKCKAWSVGYMLEKMDELISQSQKEERKRVIEEIKSWATQELKSGKDYDRLYEFLQALSHLNSKEKR